MTGEERKRFLQEQGILPQEEDGLMPFPSGDSPAPATAQASQDPEGLMPFPEDKPQDKPKPFDTGAAIAGAGKAYANAYGVETPDFTKPANPNDPKEKLKRLLTPEFMQKLRTKAGITGE